MYQAPGMLLEMYQVYDTHVSVSVLIGYVIAKEYPRSRIYSYLWILAIILATFLIKQHYILDSVSGFIVALPACYDYYRNFYSDTI